MIYKQKNDIERFIVKGVKKNKNLNTKKYKTKHNKTKKIK